MTEGTILNERYKSLSKIGNGGMAIVYKALDLETNQIVAIKVLRPELAEDKTLLKRFHQEAKAVSALSHPNIVKLLDVGDSDNIHYIVMEFIEGITLKEYIKANKVIEPMEAARIALQVAFALQHAHEKGIIHRDVKPHNIMLDTDGTIRLTDFGIARTVSEATRTTQHGKDMIGTVYYISPEQVQGKDVDDRTDIYSLGVVLYEMVTGRVPFDGDTSVNIAMKHVSQKPESPRELNKNIPPALDSIIRKAMAKKFENRYEYIEDFIDDLEQFIENPDVSIIYTERVKDIDDDAGSGKSAEDEKKKKRELLLASAKLMVSAGVLFLLIFGLYQLGVKIYHNNFSSARISVPNLINMSSDDAETLLMEKGLIYRVKGYAYSSTVEAGRVVEQNYNEGDVVGTDTFIDVVISRGVFTIEVDNFVGMTFADAEMSLIGNGYIVVGAPEYVESDQPENIIVEQSIAPGTLALDGNSVTIVFQVSQGPEVTEVEVPDFVTSGMMFSSVRQLLQARGLEVGEVIYEGSATVEAGRVISQSVDPGEMVPEGTAIDFVVSSGIVEPTTKTFTITIPSRYNDEGTVVLAIYKSEYVDGERVLTSRYSTQVALTPGSSENTSVDVTLEGTGTENWVIYINNEYEQSLTVNFQS